MSNPLKFHPPEDFTQRAHLKSLDDYRERYQQSVADPAGFWSNVAERLHWF
ncbi:hypothetical protein HUU40_24205, partial [candidate division KSB1 bacterium]|nr:hypothetical protein [candidate division KSB1 bacterium]